MLLGKPEQIETFSGAPREAANICGRANFRAGREYGGEDSDIPEKTSKRSEKYSGDHSPTLFGRLLSVRQVSTWSLKDNGVFYCSEAGCHYFSLCVMHVVSKGSQSTLNVVRCYASFHGLRDALHTPRGSVKCVLQFWVPSIAPEIFMRARFSNLKTRRLR